MKNVSYTTLNCSTCMLSCTQDINGNTLCRIKGITTYNYCCNSYKPKSITIKPSDLLHIFLTCSKCKYYDTYTSTQTDMGICQYYKLRPFPGDKRKACSNFEEKTSFSTQFVYNTTATRSNYSRYTLDR